jgi:hypothetical protein
MNLESRGIVKLESISIKRSGLLTEKWVQDQIAEEPSILGLGDVAIRAAVIPSTNMRAL